MTLVLFGGVQGVGKTTLLSWLAQEFPNTFRLVNPGELFRKYFYNKRIKTLAEIEELITDAICRKNARRIVIAHWHYAVRRPRGYIPQISFSRLRRIARDPNLEHVVLILVHASARTVRERRSKGYSKKKRALSLRVIEMEMRKEREFLIKHYTIFSRALGVRRVTILHLANSDLGAAQRTLRVFF